MPRSNSAHNTRRQLLAAHLAELARSCLTPAQAVAAGVYSETDPSAVAGLLNWGQPATSLGPVLVFPYLDADGRPTGYVRLKPSSPRADPARAGKPIKYEAPRGRPNRAYLPPGTRAALADPTVRLMVVEGEKKALAADAAGFPCVGLPGVWAWQRKRARDADGRAAGPRELIPDLAGCVWAGRTVDVVYDSDAATNPNVRAAELALAAALTAAAAVVTVVRLPAAVGGGKQGLDDYLAASGAGPLRRLLAGTPAPPDTGPGLPTVLLGPDEHRANAEAAAALGRLPDLYQRAGLLVKVAAAEAGPPQGQVVRRPAGAPSLRILPAPLVREEMTRAVQCVKQGRRDEDERRAVHPPGWLVNAVHLAGDWPAVQKLDAVVTHPVFRPDGTVLAVPGYDPASRLLVAVPPGLTVPAAPTAADAAAAAATLLGVVGDFPFESEAHKAAWLAALLTPLTWFAFDGPAPLFLIDGNVRGVGKGLLADVIALILTGRRFSVMSYSNDREELRKKVTTLAAEGERLVLLDNLAGAVGNDVLDMALTADRWKDRLLGTNRVYDGPLHVCWYGTGNNVQLQADTARRVLHIRLETPDERPEEKAGFRHRDLRAHVRARRGELLAAALTVLVAWHRAGRPHRDLPSWGSYEGWSGVVRAAVVFAGLPDPGQTRLALQTQADRDGTSLAVLMAALERLDPAGRGLTAAELIDLAKKPVTGGPEAELRAAVEELCGKLDSRALGCRLRHFRRRTVGGKVLDQAGADRTHAVRWVVRPVGPAVPVPLASPAGGAVSAEDEGDAGAHPAPLGRRLWDDYQDQMLPD